MVADEHGQQQQQEAAAAAHHTDPSNTTGVSSNSHPFAPLHPLPSVPLTAASFADDPALRARLPVLPHCPRCRGCSTHLQPLPHTATFLGHALSHDAGASPAWVLRAATNRTPSGQAVVKLFCLPLSKKPQNSTAETAGTEAARQQAPVPPAPCHAPAIFRKVQLLLALDQIAADCGVRGVVTPAVWVERVDAVVPGGGGYWVKQYGLWQEVAPGVSLEQIVRSDALPPEAVLELLQSRLNSSQVLLAALFDLLTSQCDRHAQNVFVSESGGLHLIDNENALRHAWLMRHEPFRGAPRSIAHCAVDSLFLPTTQKHEILRSNFRWVMKHPSAWHGAQARHAPRLRADPQLLLDYRCHLPNKDAEVLGTDYPPQMRSCISSIAGCSVAELQQRYGLVDELPALTLKQRATDLLERGFEHTLLHGEPANPPGKRYRLSPKCCRLRHTGKRYRCAHPWAPSLELPRGNPITGGPWDRAWADVGTYDGGNSTTMIS